MVTVYVINLERRIDRKKTFLEYNSDIVTTQFCTALDGDKLDYSELQTKGLIKLPHKFMNKYIVANALTQKFLWRKCIDESKPILICEDDCVLRKDFSQQIERVLENCGND